MWDTWKQSSGAGEDPNCPAPQQGARPSPSGGNPSQGGNSPWLLCGRAHGGLGNHLTSPPHTYMPFKSESRRRGRASSCKHQPSMSFPLSQPPSSTAKPCPVPNKDAHTSGELAVGEGRQEAFACAGRGYVCCLRPRGGMEGASGTRATARPLPSQIPFPFINKHF